MLKGIGASARDQSVDILKEYKVICEEGPDMWYPMGLTGAIVDSVFYWDSMREVGADQVLNSLSGTHLFHDFSN